MTKLRLIIPLTLFISIIPFIFLATKKIEEHKMGELVFLEAKKNEKFSIYMFEIPSSGFLNILSPKNSIEHLQLVENKFFFHNKFLARIYYGKAGYRKLSFIALTKGCDTLKIYSRRPNDSVSELCSVFVIDVK